MQLPQIYEFVKGGTNSQNINGSEEIRSGATLLPLVPKMTGSWRLANCKSPIPRSCQIDRKFKRDLENQNYNEPDLFLSSEWTCTLILFFSIYKIINHPIFVIQRQNQTGYRSVQRDTHDMFLHPHHSLIKK